jgi:hypothetical protein
MFDAAMRGHTAMCKCLHSQQCPWDARSVFVAARDGQVDLLRWLMDNGCPSTLLGLCRVAARGGSVDVLTHLQQQGWLASSALLADMLNMAAYCNKLAAAQWLREQGAEWPVAFDRWRPWSAEVLAWALDEGCTKPLD